MTVDPQQLLAAKPFELDGESAHWVESVLAGLTLEQKVGQLMCVYLRSLDMDEWTGWLSDRGIEPGGMMITPRPRGDARRDVLQLQQWSALPLLIAGNLESGAVNFLSDTEAFANPMQVAASGRSEDAERLAVHCARVGNEVGVNWAFAPVIDIAFNAGNPITNTRTFGSDADRVARLGAAYVAALESRGVATTPKHFPGDGVDDRDQHLVTSNNELDAETWWATFGGVYRAAINAGARTIMVGHIRQPSLTRAAMPGISATEIMPATLAPELIDGVLRQQLGFNGLVVTDNSAMTGYTAVMPRATALPRTINAGLDMVLGNVDVETDFGILLDAARSGEIPAPRLDEAVRRVLAAKASIGLHRETDRSGWEQPDVAEEQGWRARLARESVTLVKDTQSLLPLSPDRHRRALVFVLGDEPTFYDPTGGFAARFAEGLEARGLEVELRKIPGTTATPASADRLHEDFDVCVYFANVRFIGNSNTLRIAWSPWQGFDTPRHVATLPTALVSIADPYLLQDVPMVRTAINGYTPTPATVDAAVALLFGEIEPSGTSPVDPFVGRWDAAL